MILVTVLALTLAHAESPRPLVGVIIPECTDSSALQKFLNSLSANIDQTWDSGFDTGINSLKKTAAVRQLYNEFKSKCEGKTPQAQMNCFWTLGNILQKGAGGMDFEERPAASTPGADDINRVGAISNEEMYKAAARQNSEFVKFPVTWSGEANYATVKESALKNPACKAVEFISADCGINGVGGPVPNKSLVIHCAGKEVDKWVLVRETTLAPSHAKVPALVQLHRENFFPQMIVIPKVDPATKESVTNPKPIWLMVDRLGKPYHGADGGSCITCHRGGLNSLRPLPGQISLGSPEDIESMNKKIASYPRMDVDWTKFHFRSPQLGEKTCERCHNGWERNSLHARTPLEFDRLNQRVLIDNTMPPRPTDHPYWDVKKALDKSSFLSVEDKRTILNYYNGPSTSDAEMFRGFVGKPGAACSPEDLKAARQKNLELLLERKLLTKDEFDRALAGLSKVYKEAQIYIEDLRKDRDTFALWLKGGREKCVLDTTGPVQPPASHTKAVP